MTDLSATVANGIETRRIGDVAPVQTGFAFKSESFVERGVRLLRNVNLHQGFLDWEDTVFLECDSLSRFPAYALSEGDIVLTLDRPIVANGLKVARLAADDLPALINQRVARFNVDPQHLDADYFYAFLRSPRFVDSIRGHDQSLGVPHISPDQVERVVLPLPSLSVQRRIATELAEALAAATAAQGAAKERLAAAESLPGAYLREIFEAADKTGWESHSLGHLLRRYNEVIHPGDREGGTAIFVGLEHIEPNTGRRIGSGTVNLGKLTGRKPTFRQGQVVYGYLRPYLNKVWIAEFDGCSSVDQFAFDVRSDLADTAFIAAYMRSATFLQRSHVVTTTGQLPRIGIDEIEAVQVELPPTVQDQQRIAQELASRLEAAESVLRQCRDELTAIDALPAALLRAAFEGDVTSHAAI